MGSQSGKSTSSTATACTASRCQHSMAVAVCTAANTFPEVLWSGESFDCSDVASSILVPRNYILKHFIINYFPFIFLLHYMVRALPIFKTLCVGRFYEP